MRPLQPINWVYWFWPLIKNWFLWCNKNIKYDKSTLLFVIKIFKNGFLVSGSSVVKWCLISDNKLMGIKEMKW